MKHLSKERIRTFQKKVYEHTTTTNRSLPWRTNPTPYRVLVSEIMLQQTQAERVAPKFNAFVKKFPDFESLRHAPLNVLLKTWSGLGYNRRALNLKRAAEIIVRDYKNVAPKTITQLDALPGIGPATAAAICAYAYNQPTVFIETNIRSVFIHEFFDTNTHRSSDRDLRRSQKKISDSEIIPLVEATLDTKNPRAWYNALMDYGVYLKKHFKNPSRRSAHHTTQSKFAGSHRQLRGAILRAFLSPKTPSPAMLAKKLEKPLPYIRKTIAELTREELINTH